jgi:hypothetical protein
MVFEYENPSPNYDLDVDSSVKITIYGCFRLSLFFPSMSAGEEATETFDLGRKRLAAMEHFFQYTGGHGDAPDDGLLLEREKKYVFASPRERAIDRYASGSATRSSVSPLFSHLSAFPVDSPSCRAAPTLRAPSCSSTRATSG